MGRFKIWDRVYGRFFDIKIKDCKIEDTRGGGIKILSVDGANIHDIEIENITMNTVDMPIFIRLGERLRTYRNAEKQKVGSIDQIVIKNITAVTRDLKTSRVSPPSGIFMTGTPNSKIGKVTLQDITVTLPGGGAIANIKEVSEQVDHYPEYSFFKVLPAYGVFGRHMKHLNMSHVKFNVKSNDDRKPVVLYDVLHREGNVIANPKND